MAENIFKITLTGGAFNVDKLEIDSDIAARIMRLLMPLSNDSATSVDGGSSATVSTPEIDQRAVTAKQFMTQRQPKNDMERITCLAYYLAHHKNTQTFKTIDLTHLNTEAAQPKLSNPSATSRNAVSQQYLALAGGGKKQITPRGEALVIALPNRSEVEKALGEHPLHGHGSKKKRTSKKKTK